MNNTVNQIQSIEIDKAIIFKEINAKADRFITKALVVYFLFGIAISFVYSTFTVGIGVGTLCLIAYFGTKTWLPNNTFYQYILGGVLAIFTAQFIYQMHGMFEMHFFVFVGSTILIAYQNWRLQLPLILLVVLHHASFAYLQYSGNKEIYFTQLLEKRTINEYRNTQLMESQLKSVNKNITFAEEISKGNLEYKSNHTDTSDELGNALLKMQQSLSVAAARERDEKFVTLGINQISEILRANNSNVQVLADELIRGIVKYMNLNQGGIFLLEGEGDEARLELKACYAFERKKFLKKRIEIGEGLIGQCYLERDTIYLKDVPEEYIRITSGLGDAPPSNVLLAPIQTQDEIVGVLELASFAELDQNKIEFVKKICQSIASSVVSTRITERVQRLLKDSQMQTEQLRAQEEEVRQNMEEMNATQEEMARKEQEYIQRIQELEARLK